jgi:hypothetical protein
MTVSRRTLLASAAVAPVAAAMPAAATVEAAQAVPAAATATKPYQWWISLDGGELFSESFKDEAEALRALAEYGEGMIAECQRQDFDLSLHADDIWQMLYDQNQELIGDGEFTDITKEQGDELGKMLTGVMYAWARKHKLDLEAWVFGDVRNVKKLPAA